MKAAWAARVDAAHFCRLHDAVRAAARLSDRRTEGAAALPFAARGPGTWPTGSPERNSGGGSE